jgi:integrase
MTGHIRRRGERSWELKFDIDADPLTGKRRTRHHSFKGTKREAEAELVRLKAIANRGDYVEASKLTVGDFLDRWEAWAATQVSAKTLERYTELLRHHVRSHLGEARIQRLRTVDFAVLYGKLQTAKPAGAGLAPRTVGHVHRLLHRVFGHAVKWSVIATNPVAAAEPPRVMRPEIKILSPDEIKTVLAALRAPAPRPGYKVKPENHPLYRIALIGLATGLRRGEIAALQWSDIDIESGKLRVERSLEQTNAGLAFKPPKTKAGRRTISVPASITAELRAHWREQQEQRLALGLGKAAPDDPVFVRPEMTAWPPDSMTTAWSKTIARLGLPKVTLHALRHTHVSQLIAAGLDVVTVSRRIGHSNPTVTLAVYAHLFGNADERAATIVETALASALPEMGP